MKSSYVLHSPSPLLLPFSLDAAHWSQVVTQHRYFVNWSPYFVQISPFPQDTTQHTTYIAFSCHVFLGSLVVVDSFSDSSFLMTLAVLRSTC